MIKFTKDCSIEVAEYVEAETGCVDNLVTEDFKAGEESDAEVISEHVVNGQTYVDIQFGDGSVAVGLPKELIEVLL